MVSKVMSTILAVGILPCLAQSNLLQITSPASGTIVYPGQVVTISVAADPSISNIAILAQDPLGFTQETNGQPLQFQLTIPSNTTIGAYDVGAMGTAPDGSVVDSPPISLQVDPPTTHVNLRTEPSVLRFSAPGETIPLHVIGTLPDGSEVDMTHASKMDYLYGPQIATVDSQGIVTATGYGSTYINVGPSDWGPYSVYVHITVGELATMTSPGKGTGFCSSSVTFQWNGSSVATAYRIDVGSDVGLHDYYQSGELPTTTLSQTLTGLFEGQPLFVTLWTQINGQWANNQYQYHVSCPADFTLSAAPSSLTVRTGQQGTSTITATTSGLFWACDDPIRFSASGVPWPTTASFNPSTLSTSGTSTLTVSVDRSTPVGTYPITVTGIGCWGVQHTTPITLTVVKH